MRTTLSVSRSELTSETDYDCTYCETTENVQSCKVDNTLELLCTGCGRNGKATVSNNTIKTGPFFTHNK